MCHFTKRLYFPDVVEPETQYDKYPIVDLLIIQEEKLKTLREHYDEYVAKKRAQYYGI